MDKPFQRKKVKIHEFKTRAGVLDEHHLTAGSRGGESLDYNLLLIDIYRHDAWHLLFMKSTLGEIIAIFSNAKSVKLMLRSIDDYYKYPAFHLLFGRKTLEEIILLLKRVKRLKEAQRYYLKLTG